MKNNPKQCSFVLIFLKYNNKEKGKIIKLFFSMISGIMKHNMKLHDYRLLSIHIV